MFGMIDYRAHKLYWLLYRPIWAFSWIIMVVSVLAAYGIGNYFFHNFLAVFAIAMIASFLIEIPITVFMMALNWCFNAIFKFIIDVVPADGRTAEEAWQVTIGGDAVVLSLKFEKNILAFTEYDLDRFIKCLGFLPRVLFASRIRARMSAYLEVAAEKAARGEEFRGFSREEAISINEARGLQLAWYEEIPLNYLILPIKYLGLFLLCFYANS